MNIDDALTDSQLFAPLFRPLESWKPWRACLRATFGLPLDDPDLALYRECTGRDGCSADPARELWAIVGRRGGKSKIGAAIAAWAAIQDYSKVLSRGERGTVMVIASDRQQARVVFGYIRALFETPLLAPLVERRLEESLQLTNRINVEVHSSSFRGVRGYTVVCAVLDEIAFWRGDEGSSNPDSEILAALRPAMATVPSALLVGISSPYARRGVLWDTFDRHYGKESDVLVWRAPSLVMNPSLEPRVVEAALAEDEPRARAEYLAEFRSDVEAFVSLETVRACIVPGRTELLPTRALSYRAFTDPSGGSADSWTLAIGHRERDGRLLVDALRERKAPFVPNEVAAEFAALCRAYSVNEVTGDRFAGEWPREAFRAHGVSYRPSERNKSELYQALLPVLNGRQVELLDDPRLVAQLVSLERIVSRGGRDSIDHPRRAHDDLANSLAGLCALLVKRRGYVEASNFGGVITTYTDEGPVYTLPDGSQLETKPGYEAQVAAFARRLAGR